MVSASALAKRPERLIAAAVATDFLSSERRVVVMAFLPDFTAFAAGIFAEPSIWRTGRKVNVGCKRGRHSSIIARIFPVTLFAPRASETASISFSERSDAHWGHRSEERRVGKECRSRW